MIARRLTRWLGQPRKPLRRRPLMLDTFEDRIVPTVVTFQEGQFHTVDGVNQATTYIGTADAEITSEAKNASVNFGSVVTVSIDQQDALGTREVLLGFNNIFGSLPGQIPIGSKINSAFLNVRVTSATNNESFNSFNRMLVPWDEDTATWNSFPSVATGVQFDGIEAVEFPDGQLPNETPQSNINTNIDISASLRAWSAGVSNFGWLVHQFGENGWDFKTSENTDIANRPKLTVDFTPPAGPGTFAFLDTKLKVSEGNGGTKNVTFTVLRTSGDAGAAKVDYALAASPGTATGGGVDYTFAGGTLSFADGERIKSFTVAVAGDTAIEGPETIQLTLQNPVGAAIDTGQGSSTLTLVDNDVLLNEVMNVAANADDIGYEFVEIMGTAGAALGGINGKNVYFITLNGDTSEIESSEASKGDLTNIATIGRVDLVTNLSTQSIGSNGLMVIRPTNFKYYTTAPTGTTDVIEPLLDTPLDPVNGVGQGRFDNGSVTFALVLSPTVITTGDDLDSNNDGVLDNLPAGAVLLDTVGTNDIHRPSSDRGLGDFWAGTRLVQQNGYLDAYSRFNSMTNNDLAANRIFSWYGGDLKTDFLVYEDPQISSTLGRATPNITPGAQLTPGKLNIPRAITFEVSEYSVNETAGTVTIGVHRLGDDTVAASVDYTTIDDTALAGSDFSLTAGKLDFPIGVSQKTFTVPITNDSEPEGFQSFFVSLSNPQPGQFVLSTSKTRVTITDDDSLVRDFQQDVNNYFGTRDTILYSDPTLSKDNFATDLSIMIDQDDGPTSGPIDQGLIRFDDLFGAAAHQVPAGSRIYGGQLTLNVTDGADAATRIRFFRVLQDWDVNKATWIDPLGAGSATVTNGITPDDVEARAIFDFEINPASRVGLVTVDIPADVLQSWASGSPNYGWLIVSNSGNGWDFDAADGFLANMHPKLSLIYTTPVGAGGFRFEQPTAIVNETAGTVSFTVQRAGGSIGEAKVNYSLQSGTAAAGGDFTDASGQLTFPDGVTSQSFNINISNDTFTERNETFQLKLSNPTNGATIISDAATVTIRDNDVPTVLLNEVFINPPQTDAPFEYMEIAAAANLGLGNIYLVGMEGDNNVFAGNMDVVFDLSALANGTTGFTVVKSDIGGFNVPTGTTVFTSPLLNEGNSNAFRTLQNDTNAFLVIYSPLATISSDVFDYDWNNDGTLELPAGAVILDAMGINDGTAGDINYTAATLTLPTVTPDAASRLSGNTTANDPAAWFYGDMVNLAASASRYYDAATGSASIPAGGIITPGSANYTANAVPVITSDGGGATASRNVNSGGTAVTTVTIIDPDAGQPITYSLSGPDAAKFTISQATGALTFLAPPNITAPADANLDNIYEVTVQVSDGTASDSQALSVTIISNVTGLVVNDGAPQRSRLTGIVVNFANPVDAATIGAVTLTRTAGGPATVVNAGNGLLVAPLSGTVSAITFTFENVVNAGVQHGSLADGRWQLAIPSLGYLSGLNDPNLRRLFGDSNADGTVDGIDLAAFGATFGQTGPGIAFDFNADGTVDALDFGEFGNRFGLTL